MKKNQDVYQMRKYKSWIQVLLQEQKRNINECFSVIGISPLKTKGLHYFGKAHLGKRKISTAMQCIKTKVGRSLNVDSELLNDEALKFKNEILNKVKRFDKMIELFVMKEKTEESTKMKIQILTFAPTDWSQTKKSHGCVWCFRTHCMQGSQIVFRKSYF